jgi:hypothetical protein
MDRRRESLRSKLRVRLFTSGQETSSEEENLPKIGWAWDPSLHACSAHHTLPMMMRTLVCGCYGAHPVGHLEAPKKIWHTIWRRHCGEGSRAFYGEAVEAVGVCASTCPPHREFKSNESAEPSGVQCAEVM